MQRYSRSKGVFCGIRYPFSGASDDPNTGIEVLIFNSLHPFNVCYDRWDA
ncbi:MAG: hypothetical protein JRH15_09480 [Deltaproteobacteria bacterium]|nr:hypothetical protein [Deltaproteobacteria bacterium]